MTSSNSAICKVLRNIVFVTLHLDDPARGGRFTNTSIKAFLKSKRTDLLDAHDVMGVVGQYHPANP
jgi:hypothetical protein